MRIKRIRQLFKVVIIMQFILFCVLCFICNVIMDVPYDWDVTNEIEARLNPSRNEMHFLSNQVFLLRKEYDLHTDTIHYGRVNLLEDSGNGRSPDYGGR